MTTLDRDHLISWLLEAPLYAVLVNANRYGQTAGRWLADIAGAEGIHEPLTGKKIANGRFYAQDLTFGNVRFPAAAVVVYVRKGTPRQSPVLIYANDLAGFPTQGRGGDVIIPFSGGVLQV